MRISTRPKNFLDEKQIPYSVMTHTTAYTAQAQPLPCAYSLRKVDATGCRLFFLMVCVAKSSSRGSSVGGIELARDCIAGVAIWLRWVNLVIHGSALHAAGLTLSKADAVYAWR
jgi:hypothetical protein